MLAGGQDNFLGCRQIAGAVDRQAVPPGLHSFELKVAGRIAYGGEVMIVEHNARTGDRRAGERVGDGA